MSGLEPDARLDEAAVTGEVGNATEVHGVAFGDELDFTGLSRVGLLFPEYFLAFAEKLLGY